MGTETETDETTEEVDDTGAAGDGDGAGDPLAALVAEFKDLKATLLGEGDDGDDDVTDTTTTTARASNADMESAAARAVREALDGQTKEKQRDDKIAALEKAVEKPPIKQGKVSAFLWGKAE